jgi:transposase
MKKFLIGIDVSKQKLDVCLIDQSGVINEEIIIDNQPSAIYAYLKKASKEYGFCQSELLVCAEYTGLYIYPLCCVCHESGVDLWLENPTQIKYRSGLKRGKNDKLDARKIAMYAKRFQDEAKLFSMPEKTIATLKQLIKERGMYIVDKGKYQGQLTDQKMFMDKDDYKRKSKRLKGFIKQLDEAISQTEEDIRKLIDSDPELSNQFKLLRSVEGVGEQTAVKMIVETNAFKDFNDPRKFCCHAGVAPFSYTSGSSIRSRNKVSNRADKSIKALLHMGALIVATRMKGELHDYYVRKVDEGKNKMSVLNAIRAKLVYRMFAVIRNDRMYEKNYQNSLA